VSSILYLFVDTNLFVQCERIENLDWQALGNFSDFVLIVSKPVLREIDNQKNRGNDRLGRRARATNSYFRQLIRSDDEFAEVRKSDPTVRLFIKPEYTHDQSLADRLDFNERDDQLIGTIVSYKKLHPEEDVRLLTGDGTLMAIARSLSVDVIDTPDEWLSPPEASEFEKVIKELKNENTRLKKAEPVFEIEFFSSEGEKLSKFEAQFGRMEALGSEQVDALVRKIEGRFPIATSFGRRESLVEDYKTAFGFAINRTYVPATNAEISKYVDNDYPNWLKACRAALVKFHESYNQNASNPKVNINIINSGSRPGEDALVEIEAKGQMKIFPTSKKRKNLKKNTEFPPKLPAPPQPPVGKWKTSDPLGLSSIIEAAHRIHEHDRYRDPLFAPPASAFPYARDPNGFYFKTTRPVLPELTICYECEQWRHGVEWESFGTEIHFGPDAREVDGAIEVKVHAGNLSHPKKALIPVKISIHSIDGSALAAKLVDDFIRSQ